MTDSMGQGKLVRHMQNLSYTYDTYLICIGRGPSISSVIDKSLSYNGPSYPSLPVFTNTTWLILELADDRLIKRDLSWASDYNVWLLSMSLLSSIAIGLTNECV